MESRSGRRSRRQGAQPPRGSRRRRPGGDSDGVDRISGLNDDLLIQVLVRLRSATAAARTGVLSRRWRDLWKHLPELTFRGIAPDAIEAALAQVAIPKKLSLLDIDVPHQFSAEVVASLLRTAAHLDPVELSILVWVDTSEELIAIEVPSFARATSIRLRLHNLHLTPPEQGGEFPVLERLSITAAHFDINALISRCPYLRVLEAGFYIDTITIHLPTIEEIRVTSQAQLRSVNIVAPLLKKFTLGPSFSADFSMACFSVDFGMSLLAPKVENLSYNCSCPTSRYSPMDVAAAIDGIGMWFLKRLKLGMERFVLCLDLQRPFRFPVIHMRNLQEMFQLPNISVLELRVETRGHVYGAMVVNLMRICNAIQRLKVVVVGHMFAG